MTNGEFARTCLLFVIGWAVGLGTYIVIWQLGLWWWQS